MQQLRGRGPRRHGPLPDILDAAREHEADVIGLSGLITPSLDEMVTVAREMSRQEFDIPLLIGGATTSVAHTAVRIEPEYPHGVIHVKDASRSVTTMNQLVGEGSRADLLQQTASQYAKTRADRASRADRRRLLSIDEARARRETFDWPDTVAPAPTFTGTRVFHDYPLDELVDYIDWTPFFLAWELRGAYPAILRHPTYGREARTLFRDARNLLDKIISLKAFTASAVVGFYPANSVGDDVHLYTDDTRDTVLTTFHFLRQQSDKSNQRASIPRNNFCLADFIAPRDSGVPDHIGAFVVTAGLGGDEFAAALEAAHDDYGAIMSKALADRLAEAFAERMHERVRRELWAYAPDERLTNERLIKEDYRGIRPAPGYPACPDHTEKAALWRLLDAERATGARLTENYAIWPTASVAGHYFAHPNSHYFGVGRLAPDQLTDYATRKGISVPKPNAGSAPTSPTTYNDGKPHICQDSIAQQR